MKQLGTLLVTALLLLSHPGCKPEAVEEPYTYNPTPYEINIPAWFPPMEIPAGNPTTVQGVKLGRMLYYDTTLHPTGELSCAGCHTQQQSFSSAATVLPHVNLAWSTNFLWDGRVRGTLEDIMLFEVTQFFKTDLTRLQNHPEYPRLFYEAFGTKTITAELAAKALAQWERTLVSGRSTRDMSVWADIGLFLSDEEVDGALIFYTERGDCFHCHGGVLFTDNQLHNNGLDADPALPGYAAVSGKSSDYGKFKTPTLRNIALTAPYMHDGRYQTLEEVINFYSEHVHYSPTVDPLMKKVNQGGLHLTTKEKSDLLAFLKTLTDTTFIQDPSLKNPF